jgi:tetratricopeptide (TPR) repeat protein
MKHVSFPLFVVLVCLAASLTACSHDPNVRKQKYYESGQRYSAEGKYREAVIEYRNATQVDPTFADAHFQLAEALLKLQDWQHAYFELGRTLELQPDNYKAHIDIANLLIVSGEAGSLRMAQEHTDLLLQKQPNDPETHITIANLMERQKRFDEAIAEAQKAIALAPDHGDYYLKLAMFETQANLPEAAEPNYKKAIELKATAVNPGIALAAFYQSRERYAEAEQEVQQVIASNPRDVDSRAALAKLYMAEGKRTEAEAFLKQVKQQFPDNSAGYRMLGDFYYAIGDLDKAMAEYQFLYHDHPKDLRVQKNYIQLLLLKDRVDEAKQIDDRLLKSYPKDPDGLVFRGEIQLKEKKPGDAVGTLQSIVSSNPEMALAHYQLGVALNQTGDPDRAAAEWHHATQLNPNMVDAHRALANFALEKKDMSGLEHEATQVINLQPASPDGYVMRAVSLMAGKQYAGAEQDCRKAIEIAPQSGLGYLHMGNLRALQGKQTEAESWYKQALSRDPNSPEALRSLMDLFLIERQLDKAITAAKDQIATSPNNAAFYDLLGSALMTKKDFAAAETALNKAVELDPTNDDAVVKLAQSQAVSGQLDDAVATCNQGLSRDPKQAAFYALIGSVYEKKHDLERAKSAYQKALDLKRDDPVLSNNLAYVLLESNGNPDLALQLAQTARRAMPESSSVADTLGWAFYQKGVYQSAISMFAEAIKLAAKNKEPENATYHYHLGLAYAKASQPALAKQNFERVLKIDPNYSDAADVKKQLAQLKS